MFSAFKLSVSHSNPHRKLNNSLHTPKLCQWGGIYHPEAARTPNFQFNKIKSSFKLDFTHQEGLARKLHPKISEPFDVAMTIANNDQRSGLIKNFSSTLSLPAPLIIDIEIVGDIDGNKTTKGTIIIHN